MENIAKKLDEGIDAILKDYYPQQLKNPEFKKAIYKNFDNKNLATFVIEKIDKI